VSGTDTPSVLVRLRQVWRETALRGAVLPSEEALARDLGASKSTIREALIRLEAEGLVRRAQGAGTFPNLAALDVTARLDRRIDYSRQLEAAGFTPGMTVISAGLVTLDPARAALLEIAPGLQAFETLKRWTADGVPVMAARDLVPLRRQAPLRVVPSRPSDLTKADRSARDLRGLPGPGDAVASVLELAESYGTGAAEWISTWPGAVNADAQTADLLDVEPGLALLTLEHIGVSRDGGRCFHAFEYHAAGFVRYGLTLDAQHDR
jgi:GntR family transcriptional regulator